jgi:hypothetical protein
MKLLSDNNKISKGEKFGFYTLGIHLSPAKKSGYEVCSWRSEGCAMACLDTAGMGAFSNVQQARINRTHLFFENKHGFFCKLAHEISLAVKRAERKGLVPCFRLNLTSDLPWEGIRNSDRKTIFELFPTVQFYDYTKGFSRMRNYLSGKMPSNYHLTFSRSESNQAHCDIIAELGGNVACVFRNELPKTWQGKRVINGDESDLRFRDPKGCIVGLVEKGRAKKDESGFVLN